MDGINPFAALMQQPHVHKTPKEKIYEGLEHFNQSTGTTDDVAVVMPRMTWLTLFGWLTAQENKTNMVATIMMHIFDVATGFTDPGCPLEMNPEAEESEPLVRSEGGYL